MRIFAQTRQRSQQQKTGSLARPHALPTRSYELAAVQHVQPASGNQAEESLLPAEPKRLEAGAGSVGTNRFGHDFSLMPVCAGTPARVQAKRTISAPGDVYEEQADSEADEVMSLPGRACSGEESCPRCRGLAHDLTFTPETSQDRLTLSRPGDYFEREADRAAAAVMSASGAAPGSPLDGGPGLQAHTLTGQEEPRLNALEDPHDVAVVGSEVSPQTESEVRRAAGGGGAPLPKPVRDFFEPRFGHDFSRVRIHADRTAASTSQSLRAAAFTFGPDIFFNAGQYRPDTGAGLGLLAHELAHVIQQQAGRVSRRVIQRADVPYQQITWADFQKTAAPPNTPANVGAVIRTKFDMIPSYSGAVAVTPTKIRCRVKGRRDTQVEATAAPDPVDFTKPEAFMVQEESWAQPRFKSDVRGFCRGRGNDVQRCMNAEVAERARLLKHEQGHFDITNIMAKNMRESQSLKAKSLPVRETRCGDQAAREAAWEKYRRDVSSVLTDLGKEWLALREKAQEDYDVQTGRGGNQTSQSAWENSIKDGLKQYYPPTAPQPAAPAPAQTNPPAAPSPTNPPSAPAPAPAPKR
ncbi:MAG: DUF4157 domain-containing protein [Acidobacteriota bacterium]|nr:DUF4157 domain-containing protein [Acidobacteriota bacterium]